MAQQQGSPPPRGPQTLSQAQQPALPHWHPRSMTLQPRQRTLAAHLNRHPENR